MTQAYPLLTSQPPNTDDRFLYTYYGQLLLGSPGGCWMRDSARTKPTLVLGTTGCGKTEGMLSRAFQDASKGRPVIFIDGKCDRETWRKLYYYNHCCAGRPFYALFPTPMLDRLSMSWNPLHSTLLPIQTVVESLFNTYTRNKGNAGAAEFYYETQRNAFTLLCQTLHASGYGFTLDDVVVLLEHNDVLMSMAGQLNPESLQFYSKLLSLRNSEPDFVKHMRGFLNFLKLFDHWSLNTYNPDIQLDRLYYTDATIYVGLPVNAQQVTMSTIGNLLINQLRALANYVQAHGRSERDFSVFIDEAGPFIDTALAEWIGKARSSGFLLEIAVQTLADLARVNTIIAEQIKGNTPNILLYNPQDLATAKAYSELFGNEDILHTSIATPPDGDQPVVTQRLGETPKIHPDIINQLRIGQCVFRPSERIYRPPLLAGSMLPPPPTNPVFDWHGGRHNVKPELYGLHMKLRLDVVKRTGSPLQTPTTKKRNTQRS